MICNADSIVCIALLIICFVLPNPNKCNADNLGDSTIGQSNIILWNFTTNGPIFGSPLVEKGIVYIGSLDSCLYAIDSETGVEIWHYKSQNQIFSIPVKQDTILCFESGNDLYGVNLDGILSWKFKLYDGPVTNMHDQWDYYHSSPLLRGDTVYIGTEAGHVYGIDIRTGLETFHCQTPSASYTIETRPAIYNNKIYFGDWDGEFYAYNLLDGNLVWQYDTKDDGTFASWVNAIVTDPVIYNGAVYFGGRNCRFYCLDAETGTKQWSYNDPNNQWMIGGPTLMDSILYVGSSYQHVAHAFNAKSGTLLWKKSVIHRANGKPMIDGELVYIGTQHNTDKRIGTLCALNKSDGNMKVNLDMKTQLYSSPVLSDSIIYFGGYNGLIYALDQKAFNNIKYPKTYNTIPPTLDLGTFGMNGDYDSTFYFYNQGNASDSISISISSYFSQKGIDVTIDPAKFVIAAQDSKTVRLTINFDSLNSGSYSGRVTIKSIFAMIPTTENKKVNFLVATTAIKNLNDKLPKSYSLDQNYPNPFNPVTCIQYNLPKDSNVSIIVYNVQGQKVKELINEFRPAGSYNVTFDAIGLASGMYFYKIHANEFIDMKRMLLIK